MQQGNTGTIVNIVTDVCFEIDCVSLLLKETLQTPPGHTLMGPEL